MACPKVPFSSVLENHFDNQLTLLWQRVPPVTSCIFLGSVASPLGASCLLQVALPEVSRQWAHLNFCVRWRAFLGSYLPGVTPMPQLIRMWQCLRTDSKYQRVSQTIHSSGRLMCSDFTSRVHMSPVTPLCSQAGKAWCQWCPFDEEPLPDVPFEKGLSSSASQATCHFHWS